MNKREIQLIDAIDFARDKDKTWTATAHCMVAEIIKVAKDHGLVGEGWALKATKISTKGGASRGGQSGINIKLGGKIEAAALSEDARAKWYLQNAEWVGANSPGRRAGAAAYRRAAAEGGHVFNEYKSIAADPEIGYAVFEDPYGPVAALIAHEIAHAIDYTAGRQELEGRTYGPSGSGHGAKWQAIYRVLRRHYVNNGAYKAAPPPKREEAKVTPIRRLAPAFELTGLPLFDIAA